MWCSIHSYSGSLKQSKPFSTNVLKRYILNIKYVSGKLNFSIPFQNSCHFNLYFFIFLIIFCAFLNIYIFTYIHTRRCLLLFLNTLFKHKFKVINVLILVYSNYFIYFYANLRQSMCSKSLNSLGMIVNTYQYLQ